MLNFKSFRCANCVLAGIELIHMVRKSQFVIDGAAAMSLAEQFLRWQEWSERNKPDNAPPGKLCRLINNATEPDNESRTAVPHGSGLGRPRPASATSHHRLP